MLTKLVFAVCLLSLSAVLGVKPDYYWMPFTGELPQHAFLTGCNDQNTGVYLGKAHYDVGVLPGYVHEGEKSISGTARRDVYSTDDGIKVMCTRKPTYYEWVQVNGWADLPDGDNVHFVESGQEPGLTLRTARIQHDGVYLLGKIFFFNPIRFSAEFVYKGQHMERTSFEILVLRDEPVRNSQRFECRH